MGNEVWVAGVDGCPGGWIALDCPAARPDMARLTLFPTFAEVLDAFIEHAHIAIDMPIGLPERAGPGGRDADAAARRRLGARQSAVFSVPSRQAVMQTDYGEACQIAALTSDPPRKVAKQTFHLFPKIREVDALMSPALQSRVVECHPELAFVSLNGGQPLGEPKKVTSRPYPAGLELRMRLLEQVGFTREILEPRRYPSRLVGADDVLDAAACCAAAIRMMRGTAWRLPDDPPIDARGLRMEIWG